LRVLKEEIAPVSAHLPAIRLHSEPDNPDPSIIAILRMSRARLDQLFPRL
jgi:hypothetical protein